jgi:hypothetical protein
MTVPLSEIRLLSLYSDGAPSMRLQKCLSALVQSCWNGFAILDRTSFYQPKRVRFRTARIANSLLVSVL